MSVFNYFLHGHCDQPLWRLHWNGLNSLLLATKEHLCHISVLLLPLDLKPIPTVFVMHHNSMTVNVGTRERNLCNQHSAQHRLTIVNDSHKIICLFHYYVVLPGVPKRYSRLKNCRNSIIATII